MSWIDRLIEVEDRMVAEAVARERESGAKLAEQWADVMVTPASALALRNFAAALRRGQSPSADGVGASDGKVPRTPESKSK